MGGKPRTVYGPMEFTTPPPRHQSRVRGISSLEDASLARVRHDDGAKAHADVVSMAINHRKAELMRKGEGARVRCGGGRWAMVVVVRGAIAVACVRAFDTVSAAPQTPSKKYVCVWRRCQLG